MKKAQSLALQWLPRVVVILGLAALLLVLIRGKVAVALVLGTIGALLAASEMILVAVATPPARRVAIPIAAAMLLVGPVMVFRGQPWARAGAIVIATVCGVSLLLGWRRLFTKAPPQDATGRAP